MRGKCNRCDGRGYKKLPLGTYGMIKCHNCNGSGKDPVEAVKEACKRALGLNPFNNRAELLQKGELMKTSLDRKVIVGDYVMLDATIHPPPKHQQVLCGSIRYGTTIKGVFDTKHHDCWLPMPRFPDSVKERYRQEVENGTA